MIVVSLKLNFESEKEAQDMIRLIQTDKGLSVSSAIEFAVGSQVHQSNISTGWLSIALSIWGYDNPERKWLSLENSLVIVDMEEDKFKLVQDISKKKVSVERAVAYFLLLTMKSLGYHI